MTRLKVFVVCSVIQLIMSAAAVSKHRCDVMKYENPTDQNTTETLYYSALFREHGVSIAKWDSCAGLYKAATQLKATERCKRLARDWAYRFKLKHIDKSKRGKDRARTRRCSDRIKTYGQISGKVETTVYSFQMKILQTVR